MHLRPILTAVVAAATLIFMGVATTALAQRGEGVTTNLTPDHTGPAAGFPGFFDTEMCTDGSFVLELPPVELPVNGELPVTPYVEADYGASPTLTIGTNALMTAVPLGYGGIGASLKVRSLVYGSSGFQSAATLYVGDAAAGSGTKRVSGNYTFATSNEMWILSKTNRILASVLFGRFEAQQATPSDLQYANVSVLLAAAGGGYQHIFSDRLSLTAFAMIPAYQKLSEDTATASLSLADSNASAAGSFALARVHLDLHAGQRWLESFGVTYMPPLYPVPAPFFSAALRF